LLWGSFASLCYYFSNCCPNRQALLCDFFAAFVAATIGPLRLSKWHTGIGDFLGKLLLTIADKFATMMAEQGKMTRNKRR